MYEPNLMEAGLTKEQAEIYEILVQNGPLPAGRIQRRSTISRPLVYKVLEQLVEHDLVEKKEIPHKPALFVPAHPLKLKDMVEKQHSRAERAQTAVDGILGKLTSDFNLVSGKPGVRFFEGKEGIRECINDALSSKTEIYSYVDIAALEKHIPEISRDFAKDRRRLGIRKKNISIDTPENRKEIEGYYTDVTQERLVPWPTATFGTVMQIYDGKISYLTLDEPMIGVIIVDPHIYEMHRSLFEVTWNDPRAYIPADAKS
jgi:HTH-type transcriptional regulator, sugar sensing transcriptional regulator